jgi:2-octaprenyl-6-methoxyphenol hydroxylase
MNAAQDQGVLDAFIVGAGPVGLAAGCALRAAGLQVSVADAGPAVRALEDSRVIALSAGSRDILRGLQAWPATDTTPIRRIHISQRGHFGRTELRAGDYGVDALGHVARAGTLVRALRDRAQALGLHVMHDTPVSGAVQDGDRVRVSTAAGDVTARVLLWCEGRITDDEALSRSRDYDQHALIALATPDRPHGNVAFERFTPDGPVALLPCGRDYAVVYTCASADSAALMAETDAAFAERLAAALGGRVHFSAIGARTAWPLALRMRTEIVRDRQVWLGNAAQTLHPGRRPGAEPRAARRRPACRQPAARAGAQRRRPRSGASALRRAAPYRPRRHRRFHRCAGTRIRASAPALRGLARSPATPAARHLHCSMPAPQRDSSSAGA